MKTTEMVTGFFVVLLLTLTSVSSVQRLNSISDLKRIPFGQSVPEQMIVLLYWFANTVEIENNEIRLNFDPNNEDYGSHHYGNYERILDPTPYGQKYYAVGNLNLNQHSPLRLPHYVVSHRSNDTGRNRARIIIRVWEFNTGPRAHRIEQVYITQHYETSSYQGTMYDPNNTYEISTNLLRQIRAFSVGNDQRSLARLRDQHAGNTVFQLNDIRNTWGALAGLGLLLVILLQRRQTTPTYTNQFYFTAQSSQTSQRFHSHNDSDWGICSICLAVTVVVIILILAVFILVVSSRTNQRW